MTMKNKFFFVPEISKNQLKNTKLYPSRKLFIETLNKNINVLEVGTGGGDYAQMLLDNGVPKQLDLLDTFNSLDFYLFSLTKLSID